MSLPGLQWLPKFIKTCDQRNREISPMSFLPYIIVVCKKIQNRQMIIWYKSGDYEKRKIDVTRAGKLFWSTQQRFHVLTHSRFLFSYRNKAGFACSFQLEVHFGVGRCGFRGFQGFHEISSISSKPGWLWICRCLFAARKTVLWLGDCLPTIWV